MQNAKRKLIFGKILTHESCAPQSMHFSHKGPKTVSQDFPDAVSVTAKKDKTLFWLSEGRATGVFHTYGYKSGERGYTPMGTGVPRSTVLSARRKHWATRHRHTQSVSARVHGLAGAIGYGWVWGGLSSGTKSVSQYFPVAPCDGQKSKRYPQVGWVEVPKP